MRKIAEDCGLDEIFEILQRLDDLSQEKKELEEWDDDSQDDIWRVQKGFSELLEKLTPKYSKEIATGFKSKHPETRFLLSWTFRNSPNINAVPMLEEYLLSEMPEHYKEVGISALKACSKKK